MSDDGRSPFNGGGLRTTKPRTRQRRCITCRREMDSMVRLIRCGPCEQQRITERDLAREEASLSSPAGTVSLPDHSPQQQDRPT